MNIILFSRIIALSGVGNHVASLAEELDRQGHNVIVVSSTNDRHIGEVGGVRFIKLEPMTPNPLHIMAGVKKLHKIINDNKIQVVHCHHRMAAMYMKFYRMGWNVPVVYSLHLAGISSDIIHRTMTYPGDKAIGVSEEVCEYLVNELRVPKEKVIKILNGVNEKKLLPLSNIEKEKLYDRWSIPSGNTIVSMHSRIDPMKNQLLMVEAVHNLPSDTKKKLTVLISGTKSGEYYEKVKDRIRQNSIDEKENGEIRTSEDVFLFTGWTETRDILGISDALILPAINDGFALSVLEAFHMNVLVARTETAGFSDQKYCIPIDGEKPDDIEKLIKKLVHEGKDSYQSLIKKAHDYALQEFTIKRMTEKTVDVYKEVIQKGKI